MFTLMCGLVTLCAPRFESSVALPLQPVHLNFANDHVAFIKTSLQQVLTSVLPVVFFYKIVAQCM